MKKLLIFFLLIFIPTLYSQSDSTGKGFSLGIGIGYLFPQVDDGPGGIRSGPAIKPSLNLKTSNNVSWYIEFSYSRLKHEPRFEGSIYYNDYLLSNAGLKIFPKAKEKIYIKTGLGLAYSSGNNHTNYGYSINLGIGNDFILNHRISLFAEGEISLHQLMPYLSWNSLYDLTLCAGIKYKL